MNRFNILFCIIPISFLFFQCSQKSEKSVDIKNRFIQVSNNNPNYFQFSDGSPYIPIGINMINPSRETRSDPEAAIEEVEQWMKALSENGGNYVRIWLSQSFWDIEDSIAGQYSEEKAARIDRFVEMARKYGLRIKMTFEHFRGLTLDENPKSWSTKFIYHTSKGGPLDSIRQYLTTDEGHKLFLDKLDFYQKRYGSDTLFFGWELWNEMNAMRGPEDEAFFVWNEKMLSETKNRFPENLVMQSFGSFDRERVRDTYRRMILLPDNEVAQIHRYLDLGADMEICQSPMDLICSSAIEELRTYNSGKPMILAETGAVEPKHTGPSKFYPLDTTGILLHDLLFAPFFAGSAGTGMSWHWESYVHKNDLWYHFGRFSNAIEGINPLEENFQASKAETNEFRIYHLVGEENTLLWIRDKQSTWQSELRDGIPAQDITDAEINLEELNISAGERGFKSYDPWKDSWQKLELVEPDKLRLPAFRRSFVVRISFD